MENSLYVGAVISDMHCGAFDAKQWYRELEKEFLEYIEKLTVLDYVIITGDFFDTKISMNSEYSKYALMVLMRIIRACISKHAKFRILKGTESHDNKQLEIFEILLKYRDECDFKIIHTVESEMLFDDMKVLYIPEEYMANKDEYYAEYFNQTYDMIFGHGMVNEALGISLTQESEVTMSKAPVFKTEDLVKICKGPIFFGHIHKRMQIKGRFYYVNSFSRWSFGEEEDKGFYMCFYTPETGDYKAEYVVNKSARKFDTVGVEYSSPLFNQSEKDQVEYLVKLADNVIIDYLRIEVNIPEDYANPTLLTKMLNEVFSYHKQVKLKIINNSKLRQNKEMEEKVNKLLDRYGFLFDKSIETEEKLVLFIKEKYGRNIPVEAMKSYLYDSITGEAKTA